jgi:hypothetical protein
VDPATDLTADQAEKHAARLEDDDDQRCVLVCTPMLGDAWLGPRLAWVSNWQLHPAPHAVQVLSADAASWLAVSEEAARAAICNFQLRQICCDLWSTADFLSTGSFCEAAQKTSYWTDLHKGMYNVSSFGDMVALLKTWLLIFRPIFRLPASSVWTAEADSLLAMPHITMRQVAGLYKKLAFGSAGGASPWPGQVVKWERARIAYHDCEMDTTDTDLWMTLKEQMDDIKRPLLFTSGSAAATALPLPPMAAAPALKRQRKRYSRRAEPVSLTVQWPMPENEADNGRQQASVSPPRHAAAQRCWNESQAAADAAVKAMQLSMDLHVICADLSQEYGVAEATPIPVLALDPNHPMPPRFRYITRREGVADVAPDKDWRSASTGCHCAGGPCGPSCLHVQFRDALFKHDKDFDCQPMAPPGGHGRLSYLPEAHGTCILHAKEADSHLHECGDLCACSPDCPMRVLQHGVRRKLVLMPTNVHGWGVFAAEAISRGQFLGEYVGCVITDKQAESRADDEYLFDIYHRSWGQDKREGILVVDANEAGNVTRFFNHSCLPNCTVRLVHWDSDDPRLAHLAFYALRTIPAGVELTINYGYECDKSLPKQFKVPCNCGAGKACRKWLRNTHGSKRHATPRK